jgi:hypothetical protein
MTSLFKKLNYNDSFKIFVLNAPFSFEDETLEMEKVTLVLRSINNIDPIDFILCFAQNQAELDKSFIKIKPLLKDDAVLWVCYPKKSSKNYQCDFNRDTGFDKLREAGLDSVRIVSIDRDWSALRFRNVSFIKK